MSRVSAHVRIRPTDDDPCFNVSCEQKTIVIQQKGHRAIEKTYSFDSVHSQSSQNDVFQATIPRLVDDLVRGISGTLLCFGPVGSGKTFTMSGPEDDYDHRGLLPRAVSLLFKEVETNTEAKITVRVSYMEIRKDVIYDLLSSSTDGVKCHSPSVYVREDHDGNCSIKGLKQQIVRSEEEALESFFLGKSFRKFYKNPFNETSSRGHTVFRIDLEISSRNDPEGPTIRSLLDLVDIAGVNRLTDPSCEARAESVARNRTLINLELVLSAIRHKTHAPFRQSPLTRLLRSSLNGSSNISLLLCLRQEQIFQSETIAALKMTTRLSALTGTVETKEIKSDKKIIQELKDEIKQLQKELVFRDSLTSTEKVSINTIEQWLAGTGPEPSVTSLKETQEIFKIFKKIAETLKTQNTQNSPNSQNPSKPTELKDKPSVVAPSVVAPSAVPSQPMAVTDLSNLIAPDDSRPPEIREIENSHANNVPLAKVVFSAAALTSMIKEKESRHAQQAQESFEEFKTVSESGKQIEGKLREAIELLTAKRELLKEQAEKANRMRDILLGVSAHTLDDSEDKGSLRTSHSVMVAQCKSLKVDIESIQSEISCLKRALVDAFDEWHSTTDKGPEKIIRVISKQAAVESDWAKKGEQANAFYTAKNVARDQISKMAHKR